MEVPISRRRLLHGAVAAAAVAHAAPVHAQAIDSGRQAMAGAATAFLASLDARQRRRAGFFLGNRSRDRRLGVDGALRGRAAEGYAADNRGYRGGLWPI